MEKGILIVSFGTTFQDTREKNIDRIIGTVHDKYSDCEVLQAYSSDKIRHILKSRDQINIPSIGEALEQMKELGVRQVIVLPTYLIDGYENHKMKRVAEEYRADFQTLQIAGVLLEEEEDYRMVAKALWDSIKDAVDNRIVIFMGHGTYMEADESYRKMEEALRAYSGKEIYIATVKGKTTLEEIIQRMRGSGFAKEQDKKTSVFLTPFMLTAGDHVMKDMIGGKNSFFSKLEREGFETECMVCGIGEFEKIREIYINHLQKAGGGNLLQGGIPRRLKG